MTRAAVSAIDIWQRLHWAFFVNTQGLYLALSRFELALQKNDLQAAELELRSAAIMMRAAGASMQLAGSFSPAAYDEQVRPSMMPPHVGADDFSGLMSWDHASLIVLWRNLSRRFADLPPELHSAHGSFVAAYRVLATSHTAVCKKFAGETGRSIRSKNMSAVGLLERFSKNRLKLLDPKSRVESGCPLSPEA